MAVVETRFDGVKTPGELFRQFAEQYCVPEKQMASDLKISVPSLQKLYESKLRIDARLALYLSKYFGTRPEKWLDAQIAFDIREALTDKAVKAHYEELSRAQKPRAGLRASAWSTAAAQSENAKAEKPSKGGRKSGKTRRRVPEKPRKRLGKRRNRRKTALPEAENGARQRRKRRQKSLLRGSRGPQRQRRLSL